MFSHKTSVILILYIYVARASIINAGRDGCSLPEITKPEINVFVKMSIPFRSPPQPTAMVMVGGPGSGKSLSQKKTIELIGADYRDFVIVDPDRVLTALFNSDNNCYARVQPVLESLIDTAYEMKKNIVLDSTGRDYQRSRKFAERFKRRGYVIVVSITMIDPQIALARASQRQASEGRSVDESYLRSAYDSIQKIVPQYIESRLFNKVFAFNNSGPTPVCELSFDREAACRHSVALCGQLDAKMPEQQATVCLYDNNGPVEDITVPYEFSSSKEKLMFKYSWIGLPDWDLALNQTHVTQMANPACAHSYSVERGAAGAGGRIVLSIRIARDAVWCVPSLPQKESPYWKERDVDHRLLLAYDMEAWSDACSCTDTSSSCSSPDIYSCATVGDSATTRSEPG